MQSASHCDSPPWHAHSGVCLFGCAVVTLGVFRGAVAVGKDSCAATGIGRGAAGKLTRTELMQGNPLPIEMWLTILEQLHVADLMPYHSGWKPISNFSWRPSIPVEEASRAQEPWDDEFLVNFG